MDSLQTYAEVKRYLYGLKYHGAKYGIERMSLFTEALGHPQKCFPCIHIAGTNGKGSTAAMLEAIYRRAGYKTGLFTSPHLVHQGERIQVNRQLLEHDAIVCYTQALKPVAEDLERREAGSHPSFFEFMTAMAFLRFAQESVDIGIIETGLGGRLDATNVVTPEISVITSISYDHTEILGDTLAQIASEKAGIIKPGKPVVMGLLPEEAASVIRSVARERGCRLYSVADSLGGDVANYPLTNLPGDYQRCNAATASLVVEVLQQPFPVDTADLQQALLQVDWAGRWDTRELEDGKRIILDATHNPEGVIALESNLQRLIQEAGKQPIILAGCLGDQRAAALMPVVSRYARELYLLRPNQPRATSLETLTALVPATFRDKLRTATVSELFPRPGMCILGKGEDTLVVTGSIYLVGEVLEALQHSVPVAEHTLQD